MTKLQNADPEVWQAIEGERRRQQDGLEMIASENYSSAAVLEAQGSVLTNKYAEGYPGRRYYGGCEFVDVAERLAIDRLLLLFGAERANVQPHSGAQANMAVYFACLEPGDTILAMDLAHGGHLTHGMRLNFSGKWYKVVGYGVRKGDERIDFDHVAALAREHRPKLVLAGASAYAREIDFASFAQICAEIKALFMVDMAHVAGLVAGGQHGSPVPLADFVTSTTHKTLRGPRGGFVLCKKDWIQKINSAVFPGLQGGPLMHVIAAKAVSFAEALRPEFKVYARSIVENARALADALKGSGFAIVSGGTDNHLMLVDLRPKRLKGNISEKALVRSGLTCNKNGVPYDPEKPFVTSGIRLGTPACTTRGFGIAEFRQVGELIAEVLDAVAQAPDGAAPLVEAAVKEKVHALTARFPIYQS